MANVPMEAPLVGGENTLEAFSEPNPDDYRCSRMRFAMTLFKLPTFTHVVIAGNKNSESQKRQFRNLEQQAHCFFYKLTHFDYFMYVGDNTKVKVHTSQI